MPGTLVYKPKKPNAGDKQYKMDPMVAPAAGYHFLFTGTNLNTVMKKTSILLAASLTLSSVVLCPRNLHAQFFKNIVNTVKQTAQNRANDKTSTTTNRALDKVDSSLQIKSGGSGPTAGAASQSGLATTGSSNTTNSLNPTSSTAANPGEQTMHALGLMTGGGGVSAADSAAAISNFMTSSGNGGAGVEFQYQTLTTAKGKNSMTDTNSVWMTNSGSGRSEMRINMPGAMSGKICTIARVSQPQYSILLDADAKTYSLMVIDTSLINSAAESYEVTVVGNETVNGYPSVHCQMKSTIGSGLFKSTSSMDIWTTKSVPGYDLYRRLCATANVKPRMMQSLENAGAGGAVIKMTSAGKGYTMSMILVKAEEKSFPAALFQIPPGYTKSDETMMGMMMSGAKH
jgi:hypothetical protein